MKTRELDEESSSRVPKHIAYMVKWYDWSARRHRNWYNSLTIALLLLAISIPVVSLACRPEVLKLVDAILAGAILLTEGLLKVGNHQTLWTKHRSAWQDLIGEVDLYLERAGPYSAVRSSDEEARRTLVERSGKIISGEKAVYFSFEDRQQTLPASHQDEPGPLPSYRT